MMVKTTPLSQCLNLLAKITLSSIVKDTNIFIIVIYGYIKIEEGNAP